MAKQIIDKPGRALSELELDDFLVRPGYMPLSSSEEVDLSAPLVRFRKGEEPAVKLHIGIVSAPMQAVFSPDLNVALAKMGGFAMSHCSQPIKNQAEQRSAVRNKKAGFVTPTVVGPEMLIEDLYRLSEVKGYSTFPVTRDGTLDTDVVGFITANDYDRELHRGMRIDERMIPRSRMVVANYREIREDLKSADAFLRTSHHGSVPVLLDDGRIKYMVFRKDIEGHKRNPHALVDKEKRYVGGDAINTSDYKERVPALVDAGSSFLYITTSQAFSPYVKETLEWVRKNFQSIPVGAGNIVTREGFLFLAKLGASCVGIGMGPGSICKTQDVIGVGEPQGSAIDEVAHARDEFFNEYGYYVPILGDGGFSRPKHLVVGYALGADAIMSGRIFAGTKESPADVDYKKNPPRKPYWGEGSEKARQWMENRYGHMRFEEGVDDFVEFVGPVEPYLQNFLFAARDGLRKGGCRSIKDAYENAVVRVVSEAAKREGMPHDLMSYKDAIKNPIEYVRSWVDYFSGLMKRVA